MFEYLDGEQMNIIRQLVQLSEDATSTTLVYSNSSLVSQIRTVILVDSHLYVSSHQYRNWHSVEFRTGKVRYLLRELGRKGNIIFL